MPCNLKWENPQFSKFVKGRKNLISTNNKSTIVNDE